MRRDGWIFLELTEQVHRADWFPYCCCECLAGNHSRRLIRLARSRIELVIPICGDCEAIYRRRRTKIYIVTALVLVLISMAAGTILWGRLTGLDILYPIIIPIGIGVGVLHFIDIHWLGYVQIHPMPHQFGGIWIRFRNESYRQYLEQAFATATEESGNRPATIVPAQFLSDEAKNVLASTKSIGRKKVQ